MDEIDDRDVRHHEEDALERQFEREPRLRGPEPGTFAFTTRILVGLGVMDGDEADRWKDEMKDASLQEDSP